MKLQDIKARTSFREQYKPGMTIDAYSPDAIKNALIFINKKRLRSTFCVFFYPK